MLGPYLRSCCLLILTTGWEDKTGNIRRLEHDIGHLIIVHSSCILCFLVANFDGLDSPARRSRVSLELSVHTSIHGTEQECRPVNGFGCCQNSVVLFEIR
jgi:hypothetical protein